MILLSDRLRRYIAPPPLLTVSEWADRYRRLPPSSAEPGRWRTSRVPFAREPMDCLSDPKVERLVLMWASQLGKTEAIFLNGLGYFIDQQPSVVGLFLPTAKMAKKFSTTRVADLIEFTPRLRALVSSPRSRDTSNTIMEKSFPGGKAIFAGSNVAADLAADAIRVVIRDEIDRFAFDAGGAGSIKEGDSLDLIEARTSTFSNRKICDVSTPTVTGSSRIEAAYDKSDRRRYWVPCPFCSVAQLLVWEQVRWDRDEDNKWLPKTAHYECVECGEHWTEAQRHTSVQKGEWIAEEEFDGTAGFHLNGLYAPWSNMSLSNLCRKWAEAQNQPTKLQAFLNTVLAKSYAPRFEALDDEVLFSRREKYPRSESGRILTPRDVVVLVCGVDVQDDRLEATVQGIGLDSEKWVLCRWNLPGDPGTDALWLQLWALICTPLPREGGGEDYILSTCVDTGGHHTQQAYKFVAPRQVSQTPGGRYARMFAVKGRSGAADQIWNRKPSTTALTKQSGVTLFRPNVDTAKAAIYSALMKNVEPGPGYIHFPLSRETDSGAPFDEGYFRELTAEKVVYQHDKRGHEQSSWVLKQAGQRNEALDCMVYGDAAYFALIAMGFHIEDEAQERGIEAAAELLNPAAPPKEPAPRAPQPRERRGSGWLEPAEARRPSDPRGGWLHGGRR